MATISRLKPDAALHAPETQFDDPWQLAAEVGLTRGQKLAALRRWEQKLVHEMAAAGEGMPTPDSQAWQADLLAEIGKAILSLQGESPA
jgi:hypothetical protein